MRLKIFRGWMRGSWALSEWLVWDGDWYPHYMKGFWHDISWPNYSDATRQPAKQLRRILEKKN